VADDSPGTTACAHGPFNLNVDGRVFSVPQCLSGSFTLRRTRRAVWIHSTRCLPEERAFLGEWTERRYDLRALRNVSNFLLAIA
jgi:hypothetical protein